MLYSFLYSKGGKTAGPEELFGFRLQMAAQLQDIDNVIFPRLAPLGTTRFIDGLLLGKGKGAYT